MPALCHAVENSAKYFMFSSCFRSLSHRFPSRQHIVRLHAPVFPETIEPFSFLAGSSVWCNRIQANGSHLANGRTLWCVHRFRLTTQCPVYRWKYRIVYRKFDLFNRIGTATRSIDGDRSIRLSWPTRIAQHVRNQVVLELSLLREACYSRSPPPSRGGDSGDSQLLTES